MDKISIHNVHNLQGDKAKRTALKLMCTYVIREVVMAWKTQAIQPSKQERKAPIRVHKARRPVKRARTAKNRSMMMKANMNRVIRK